MPKRVYAAILAAILAVVVVDALWEVTPLQMYEAKLYDTFMRYSAPYQPDPRVVIVGIDQKSLDTYGRWPWSRDVIGKLVVKLSDLGVRVTSLDMVFDTETDKSFSEALGKLDESIRQSKIEKKNPEFYEEFNLLRMGVAKDDDLASSIEKAGNVVGAFLFHMAGSETSMDEATRKNKLESVSPFRIKVINRDAASAGASIGYELAGEVEPNIPVIQQATAASGFLNVVEDRDAVFRRYQLVIEAERQVYMSLSLASAAMFMAKGDDMGAYYRAGVFVGVRVGDELIETDKYGMVWPKYYGYGGQYPVISAADVLNADIGDEKFRSRLEGKLVFVGATATQLYDLRQTPMGKFAGVEIHATMAANLLNGFKITRYDWQFILDAALIIIVGALLFFILHRTGVAVGLGLAAAMIVGIVYFNYWMFSVQMVWLNTIMPTITVLAGVISINAYQYVAEQKSKKFIRTAFSRYLSPKVVEQIVQNPQLLNLGGEKRIMTAFFSDVAGFTTISEKLSPARLVTLLNEYLSEMSHIIHELDGTVDKYEGDAIIAFWGAPLPMDQHAEMTVLSAVCQQRKLVEMRKVWREQGRDELVVRMGINTGPMVVGNMGSKERMDYTMMGDPVNLAARLEGANKYYGSSIMVSEYTYELVKDRFFCREVDMVRVQGKDIPIRLYEVIEEMDRVVEPERRFVMMFTLALTTFRLMEFEKAAELFESCDKMTSGGDVASKLYYKRCAQLIEAPPPDDWDRVYDISK
ncbi:MAG: CHASE2 domain-containing protein [Nitrospinota bacterium]|nr:CHASE2 domain-containing protein [Nitrospinota bacterium]